MMVSGGRAEDESLRGDFILDLSMIERVMRGEKIEVEGLIIKEGEVFYLEVSSEISSRYALRPSKGVAEVFPLGACSVTGNIKFNDKFSAIDFIEVNAVSKVEISRQELIEGLITGVLVLQEKALNLNDKELFKEIQNIKALISAQYVFFEKNFPWMLSKAAEALKAKSSAGDSDPFAD